MNNSYLIQFYNDQDWIHFRYDELNSLLVLAGLNPKDVYDFGAYSYSPFLRANLPSVDIAIYLCSRSILIKCIY